MANRRLIFPLAACLVLSLTLAGCGKRGDLQDPPPPGPPELDSKGKPKRVEGDPSPIVPPDRKTPLDFLL